MRLARLCNKRRSHLTLTLHLGVADVPYGHQPGGKGGMTTGDVATILEEKYHLMRAFFQVHEKEIAQKLEAGLAASLESLLTGAPLNVDPFGEGCADIEDMFKRDLAERKFDALGIPGVPTAASGATTKRKGGINHRLKHPYRQANPARPSFIDTGLFQGSFKSWID